MLFPIGLNYSRAETIIRFSGALNFNIIICTFIESLNTVEPQYSAPDWEMSKSMLFQSVQYIEVQYNIIKN